MSGPVVDIAARTALRGEVADNVYDTDAIPLRLERFGGNGPRSEG